MRARCLRLHQATAERADTSELFTAEVEIDLGAGSTSDLYTRRGGYLLASPFSTLTLTLTVP